MGLSMLTYVYVSRRGLRALDWHIFRAGAVESRRWCKDGVGSRLGEGPRASWGSRAVVILLFRVKSRWTVNHGGRVCVRTRCPRETHKHLVFVDDQCVCGGADAAARRRMKKMVMMEEPALCCSSWRIHLQGQCLFPSDLFWGTRPNLVHVWGFCWNIIMIIVLFMFFVVFFYF